MALPKEMFELIFVAFIGRLNYTQYMYMKSEGNVRAQRFLEGLFMSLYYEVIKGIKEQRPHLLDQLGIVHGDEIEILCEARNSNFHFPRDTDEYIERHVKYDAYVSENKPLLVSNYEKLLNYANQIVTERPEMNAVWIERPPL